MKRPHLLLGIFLLALVIRLLPLTLGTIVGLDSYLHRDIALRLLDTGTLLSYDPLSLLGLKAYSYPPGFHVLLAGVMLLLPPNLASQLVPALLGALTVVIVFFVSREIFEDEQVSLFSAFFFATAPSHVFRTATVLPESLGVFFFALSFLSIIKYVKTGGRKYIITSAVIFMFYMVSHRGWFIFVLSAVLFFLIYYAHLFKRKRNFIIFATLSAASYLLIKKLFLELLMRIPKEPVNALGYPKWVGIVQLSLGVMGIILLVKTRDRLKMFVIVWAVFLLGVGAMSFRFRDPYGAIPVSMLAGYALVTYVIPNLPKLKYLPHVTLSVLVLASTVQGAYTSIYMVTYPHEEDVEAMMWLRDNSPHDSVVLTWKEEGYYVIGIAERKDIIIWKKVYQGFFEEPPLIEEAKQAYKDVATIFRSTNKERALGLLDEYSVDYIYIDVRMRTALSALEYGLVEYLSYDTHFKPILANGGAELYSVEREVIKPDHEEKLDVYSPVSGTGFINRSFTLLPHIENYWNGIAYPGPPNYRTNYATNAKLALIYVKLYDSTGQEDFRDRAMWLLWWLEFEQLESGGWANQDFNMPRESVVVTCQVTEAMMDIYAMYPDAPVKTSIDRSSDFIYSQLNDTWVRTFSKSTKDVYTTDAICLPVLWRLSLLKDERFAAAARDVAENLISVQGDDGSWTYGEESVFNTVNSQTMVLEGLTKYYTLTGDGDAGQSMELGIVWLNSKQDGEGRLSDYLIEKTGKMIKTEKASYTRAAYIYGASGKENDKTVEYLLSIYKPDSGRKPLEDLVYVTDLLIEQG